MNGSSQGVVVCGRLGGVVDFLQYVAHADEIVKYAGPFGPSQRAIRALVMRRGYMRVFLYHCYYYYCHDFVSSDVIPYF